MKRLALFAAAFLCALALEPIAGAASAAAPIAGETIVSTYARGAMQFFETATATGGSTIALPLVPGATGVHVQGGTYTIRGDAVYVTTNKGSAIVIYSVPTVNNGNRLVTLHSPSKVGSLVLLAGPEVHPSGLGLAPFRLLGSVHFAGKTFTSFRATGLPAGTTIRWEFEVGQPGYLLADLFEALMFLVPLAAIAAALRGLLRGRRSGTRKEASTGEA